MKILYIVPNPPSLVRVRPYNLIKGLHARGHQVTIATVWSSAEEAGDIERLRADGFRVQATRLGRLQRARNLVAGSCGGLPLQATYAHAPELERLLLAEVQAAYAGEGPARQADIYDVVHVEHLRAAGYGLYLKDRYPRLPILWDSVDCISYLFEQAGAQSSSTFGRLAARLELGRTRRYEACLVSQFTRVLVTSPVDKTALLDLAGACGGIAGVPGDERITVLPNGVDLAYFTPADGPRDPLTILFSGKLSYHANVTAAMHLVQDVMPRVWAACPQAQVVLAGKDPPAKIVNLKRLDASGRVQVTGTVPDLRPYLRRATLAVSPLLYGAGIQNKVLEAMACGTPVVASRQAVSALQAVDGQHLLVAGDAEALAAQILNLLQDPARRLQLGEAGRAYVVERHDWGSITALLERQYAEVRRSQSVSGE